MYTQDEAGPYQTRPYPGQSWEPEGHAACQPHEYLRDGTIKTLNLFHPATGLVRTKAVLTTTNAVLHSWVKTELTDILAALPPLSEEESIRRQSLWQRFCPEKETPGLPPLRLILIWDNLAGHRNAIFNAWLESQGILALRTPLSGSWLNLTESIQRILARRALEGHEPQSIGELMAWFEQTAAGWNAHPTPFIWGGKRRQRRLRAHYRRLARSGATCICPKSFAS